MAAQRQKLEQAVDAWRRDAEHWRARYESLATPGVLSSLHRDCSLLPFRHLIMSIPSAYALVPCRRFYDMIPILLWRMQRVAC